IFGTHRIFKEPLGGFYTFMISLIEILSVAALLATVIFLSRRNLLKLPRLNMKEMLGWPKKDANLILIMEIILVFCIFTMNGTDEVLFNMGKSHFEGQGSFGFTVSQHIGPDRKSTRLNSSHVKISYAVFCLKKKKKPHYNIYTHTDHTHVE